MERPLLIITFQGVLGDFLKDGGVSTKQDHLMSKQYLKDFANTQGKNGGGNGTFAYRCESEKSLRPVGDLKMS